MSFSHLLGIARSGLVALGLVALPQACGSSSSHAPSHNQAGAGNRDDKPAATCESGAACDCPSGAVGKTTCSGAVASCDCASSCPALETEAAPSVKACGGEPFGTWRLKDIDYGKIQLSTTTNDVSVGSCDAMMAPVTPNQIPRMLMALKDGGIAEYYTEPPELTVAYSDSCVTSKVAAFTCGSSHFQAFHDCKKACDVCTCKMYAGSASPDDKTWRRNGTSLSLSLFGAAGNFDYCVSGDELQLSGPGVYLVFERVHGIEAPKACAERTADTCSVGPEERDCDGALCTGCLLGACTGPGTCTQLAQSACTTTMGCGWNADSCGGAPTRKCQLKFYGKVPGCELTTQPVTCQGTPLACDARTVGSCNHGCTFNDKGGCFGTWPCENDALCPFKNGCQTELNNKCSGTFQCSTVTDHYACEGHPGCTWLKELCAGTATACATLSEAECSDVPGCVLAPK